MEGGGRDFSRLCQICSLGSIIISLSSEQWEATERFQIAKYHDQICIWKQLLWLLHREQSKNGCGRAVGGLCNYPGKRDADDI